MTTFLAHIELKTLSMGGFGFVWKLFILVNIPEPPVKKVFSSLPAIAISSEKWVFGQSPIP